MRRRKKFVQESSGQSSVCKIQNKNLKKYIPFSVGSGLTHVVDWMWFRTEFIWGFLWWLRRALAF